MTTDTVQSTTDPVQPGRPPCDRPPVFDLYTLVMNAYEATTGTDFPS